jgi:hypothetical protein
VPRRACRVFPDHLTKSVCINRGTCFSPLGGCTAALAGARLPPDVAGAYRLEVHLAGGDDHDAADAGDAAAGFDFGDAARMAAEFALILGGAPAGQRGQHSAARARTRPCTHKRARACAHACTVAHACSHVCSLLLPCLAFCPACYLPALMSAVPSVLIPPHSQPRALRHTLLTNIMSLWIRAPRN